MQSGDGHRTPNGLRITLVHDMAGLERVAEVFSTVWGVSSASSVVSVDLLRAIAHAGGYVATAVDDSGRTVGASMGFRGVREGRPSLHSHVTGVIPSHAHRGVGRSLKQHQRTWARTEGLACITWTFDPLVRRNAWFNLQVLGADAEQYLIDFYGPLGDDINGDDETDRLLAVWWIDRPTDRATEHDHLTAPGSGHPIGGNLQAADLIVVGDDGTPAVATEIDVSRAEQLLVAVPDDVVTVRRHSPRLAGVWRQAVRDTLGRAMLDGWGIIGMTSDGRYVLRRRVTP